MPVDIRSVENADKHKIGVEFLPSLVGGADVKWNDL